MLQPERSLSILRGSQVAPKGLSASRSSRVPQLTRMRHRRSHHRAWHLCPPARPTQRYSAAVLFLLFCTRLQPDFFVQIRTLLKLREVLQQQLVQAIRQGGSNERVGLLSKDISSVNHIPSLCSLQQAALSSIEQRCSGGF